MDVERRTLRERHDVFLLLDRVLGKERDPYAAPVMEPGDRSVRDDQGWTDREIFGKVRYVSAGGLERKGKPEAYVEKVERLVEGPEGAPAHPPFG